MVFHFTKRSTVEKRWDRCCSPSFTNQGLFRSGSLFYVNTPRLRDGKHRTFSLVSSWEIFSSVQKGDGFCNDQLELKREVLKLIKSRYKEDKGITEVKEEGHGHTVPHAHTQITNHWQPTSWIPFIPSMKPQLFDPMDGRRNNSRWSPVRQESQWHESRLTEGAHRCRMSHLDVVSFFCLVVRHWSVFRDPQRPFLSLSTVYSDVLFTKIFFLLWIFRK